MAADGFVHVIMTGGTIDSRYDPTHARIRDSKTDPFIPHKNSILPSLMKQLKLSDCVFTQVCMKDSRDLDSHDLRNVLQTIETSPHTRFIVTHGTYTIKDTAGYLEAHLVRKGVTVILTGSMKIPGDPSSDALPNLKAAHLYLAKSKPGILICINQDIYKPSELPILH